MATSVGSDLSASAPLEGELRELITKLQQSFAQLVHPTSTVIGESLEDKNALMDADSDATHSADGSGGGGARNIEAELAELREIGGGIAALGATGAVEKQKPIPVRKAVPVQKVAYSQLQTSAMKQSYQTTVNANNLVHHAHSLLGLVGRLKLSMLLAHSAQDRNRQELTEAPDTLRHPLEAVHPSSIPAHQFPLHLQRTQQQLHATAMDLQAQMNEIDRRMEEEAAAQQSRRIGEDAQR
jgi:hypothetical protein